MHAWLHSLDPKFIHVLFQLMMTLLVLLATELVYRIGIHLLRGSRLLFSRNITESLANRIATSLHWLLLLLAGSIAANSIALPSAWVTFLQQILRPAVIGAAGWLITSITLAIADGIERRYSWKGKKDNLLARRVSTQLRVFRNVALFFTTVLTLIAMAMTLPGLRILGLSLFASAGVAGIVIGMAARPALSNLIAGIQLALTQPIRLDDIVIIENEWGRIEEIGSTYVVVLIWDQRRMIVPLSYFIEHPFQNWTHTTSELLGTIFLYLDYSVPLQELRQELERIASESPLWDKRVCGIQITDSKERTMEVRALISAADANALWDLRCEVREKLLKFLQHHYPSALPRLRAEVHEVAV